MDFQNTQYSDYIKESSKKLEKYPESVKLEQELEDPLEAA